MKEIRIHAFGLAAKGSKNIRNIRIGRLESANPGMNAKKLKRLNNAKGRIGRQYVGRACRVLPTGLSATRRAHPGSA
jgi:hypothetical protein